MRYALLLVATVAWALWFGGTIATFVFGLHYFHPGVMPDHAAAAAAANAMFSAFAPYQMVLAAVALLVAAVAMTAYPSRGTIALLACFVAATCMAITFGLGLLPMMEGLRKKGMSGSPQFMRLHGQSMMTMTLQAVILLGTGALLLAMGGPPRRASPRVAAEPARRGFGQEAHHSNGRDGVKQSQ